MLFTYTYVPHGMEKIQEFLDFIFFEVWCHAPSNGDFELDLFDENLDLKNLMDRFFWSDTQGGDFFYNHVEQIYNLFKDLSEDEIDEIQVCYQANNTIEQACSNQPVINVTRYRDIQASYPTLFEQISAFYKGLYSKKILDNAAFKESVGMIDEHYKSFMAANTLGKCPFCGISDVLGTYHTKREAYDHYLPKALYPFNSLNFKNLVPTCHYCNSSYKTTRDPAYTPKDPAGEIHRRKAFYPYSLNQHNIEISIGLTAPKVDDIKPIDIQFVFGPDNINEEIETWKDVYGIEERYKAKCCSETDGKAWINRIIEERKNYGLSVEGMLQAEINTASNQPYSDSNFLKKAFLNGCNEAGIFNEPQNE
jgi:hypothetical protein